VNRARTGLFGGSYDPIHIGHLFFAEAVRVEAGLDRVLFLPVGEPAHRTTHAPADERRAMVQAALKGNDHFALDATALEQPGPAYTADTIDLLRAKLPRDDFYFIAGADSLVRSPWRYLDRVAASLTRFYLVARNGLSFEDVVPVLNQLPDELAARFQPLALPLIDISSTEIRARVAQGRPIRYLTPDPVVRHIVERGLYRSRAAADQ